MHQFTFQGLGTHWSITIDATVLPPDLSSTIQNLITAFDHRFSRFRPDSEISRLNKSRQKEFLLSADLASLLRFALRLSRLTKNAFTPTVGALLEAYGYDAQYSFTPNPRTLPPSPGQFSVTRRTLTKDPGTKLDLGGLGKGFLIDSLAHYLHSSSLPFFLINGGGDIYATTKADLSPWHIAIEHPLDSTLAFGEIDLSNQGLATSSPHKRRFGDFHHLLDPFTRRPASALFSVSVLAPSALVADALATAIFITPSSLWSKLARAYSLEYLVVFPDLRFTTSGQFGKIYL